MAQWGPAPLRLPGQIQVSLLLCGDRTSGARRHCWGQIGANAGLAVPDWRSAAGCGGCGHPHRTSQRTPSRTEAQQGLRISPSICPSPFWWPGRLSTEKVASGSFDGRPCSPSWMPNALTGCTTRHLWLCHSCSSGEAAQEMHGLLASAVADCGSAESGGRPGSLFRHTAARKEGAKGTCKTGGACMFEHNDENGLR